MSEPAGGVRVLGAVNGGGELREEGGVGTGRLVTVDVGAGGEVIVQSLETGVALQIFERGHGERTEWKRRRERRRG